MAVDEGGLEAAIRVIRPSILKRIGCHFLVWSRKSHVIYPPAITFTFSGTGNFRYDTIEQHHRIVHGDALSVGGTCMRSNLTTIAIVDEISQAIPYNKGNYASRHLGWSSAIIFAHEG